MTSKEVNQQSSNTKFKLKLVKIKELPDFKRVNKGLYASMNRTGNIVQYNRQSFSIKELEEVFSDLFYGKSKNK